jgi:hypothetical protein
MTKVGRRERRMVAGLAVAAAIASAAPAQADPDIDFANQLHTYGIYGQRDYNAWLGKITCKRMARGVDGDAYASMAFITDNLARSTTQTQVAQFLGAAISTYCPEMTGVLQSAAQPG